MCANELSDVAAGGFNLREVSEVQEHNLVRSGKAFQIGEVLDPLSEIVLSFYRVLHFWSTEISTMTMKNVYLAGAVRTPIGKFGGSLASSTAADLGVAAARETLHRTGISADKIDDSIWGCARQAGGGPNVARQITYRTGIPKHVPAVTVNRACGSGLKAIILAVQEILLERSTVVLAGGTESMSRVPYYVEGARWGIRTGNSPLVDGMYRDGFSDPLSGLVMGETAENLARKYDISRTEQDEYAVRSQQRAQAAIEAGKFESELFSMEIKNRKGELIEFKDDEHPRANTTMQDLAKLPAVFSKDGTVTAGNSSGITDGAAAMLILSEDAAGKLGVKPQARIVDYEITGVAPEIMGIGPVPAVKPLLARQQLNLESIDLVELNEAFAAQVIACDRDLNFNAEKLNVNGGSIALGHPIGCTGVRITTTLVHELQKRQARLGLATLCVSGGMGFALLVERV